MSRPAALSALAFVMILLIGPARAAEAPPDVGPVVAKMAAQRGAFDPKELRALGATGLAAVLDRWLPDTVPPPDKPPTEKEVRELIAQLGHNDFDVREGATRKLIAAGRGFRDLLAQATRGGDAEVQLRAQRVLDAWDPAGAPDLAGYAEAFRRFAEALKKEDKDYLDLLARRAALALQAGKPQGGREAILVSCLHAVTRAGDDKHCDHLKPLLKHEKVEVAVFVTCHVGSARSNTFFPGLLLDALASDRESVVAEALNWAPNCWDNARKAEVKRLVRQIFDKGGEKLKFEACFPLMHDFRDPDAHRFLLEQTQSKDADRARTAIYWLGDSCNANRPATQELLDKLAPLLKSPDDELRRAAGCALGVYSGEKVVEHLIPLLGDKLPIIVTETSNHLLEKPKSVVRPHLEKAAKEHDSEAVRAKARELLEKLGEK